MSALVELRKRQAHDSETAEATHGAVLADLDWYTEGDKYVVTDKLGTPLHRMKQLLKMAYCLTG